MTTTDSKQNRPYGKMRDYHLYGPAIIAFLTIIIGTIATVYYQQQRAYDNLYYHSTHKAMYGAAAVKAIFEQGLKSRALDWEDLFDEDYKRFSEEGRLSKYTSRFSDFTDRVLLEMQDEWLYDGNIVYAVAIDRNGYLPTHNSRFSQTGTDDPKHWDRNKRIFTGPIIEKANASKNNTSNKAHYQRDTGEIIWDITAPIWIENPYRVPGSPEDKKYWGAFHVGINTGTERAIMGMQTQSTVLINLVIVFMAFVMLRATGIVFRRKGNNVRSFREKGGES